MLSRQPNAGEDLTRLVERLQEIYDATDPQTSELDLELRAGYAREAIAVWWQIYDRLVFWAQCELLGQDILQQRASLLTLWHQRNPIDISNARHLAEALGYRFSTGGRVTRRVRDDLDRMIGADMIELVKFLSRAGLAEPGGFIEELFLRENTSNAYLKAELQRMVGASRPMPSLTERDLLPAEGDQATELRWKLDALRQVRMLVGRGYRKIAALSEVANAINHTIDTLQDWERQLVKFSDLENDLYCAELVGEFEDYLRTGHYSHIRNYQLFGTFEGVLNMERAARLSRQMRHLRIADIRAALRNVA